MNSLPSNLPRVSTLLSAQLMSSSLGETSRSMLRLQVQLASGRAVNRPSDDALAASAISVMDDLIERRDQRLRNLSHAESILNNVDAAISDASDLMLEAKGIALSQASTGSDAETRASQAAVIDAMLREMTTIANRDFLGIHLFSGSATGTEPMQELLGGLRYAGSGEGMVTDLGLSRSITITSSGEAVFGALSARVQGDRDLDPGVTAETRLADLDGALSFGIRLGSLNVDVSGTDVAVDLEGTDTLQDVVDALQDAIQTVDGGASVQIDGAGRTLEIIPGAGQTVTISDTAGQTVAADLALSGTYTGPAGGTGGDLHARITPLTELTSLDGLTIPLGTMRITNGGQSRDVDLSGAERVQDVSNLVAATGLGVRVQVAAAGDRLELVNELSGASMSVAEVGGGTTATELGLRSLAASTRLDEFNDGRGVEIISGSVDPVTGTPDPARDLDFRVTLKDARTFDVDLAGAETVQDVLDAINAAAGAAGVGVPAEFTADLAADGNGIALADSTAGTTTAVTALNGSRAADDLGILGSTSGATLTGADRATVAVESVFTHLIALRDALTANDQRGITLAGERLEADITRLARARADAGVRTRRVVDATARQEDLRLQEVALRSQVQDLDFTEAAIRFATLQQQLQAGLQTASHVASLTLLDYLG